MSKGLLDSTTIMFLAGIVLIAVLASYSSSKGTESFQQTGGRQAPQQEKDMNPTPKQVTKAADASAPQGASDVGSYSSVSGMDSQMPKIPGCSSVPVTDPKDLLPPAGSNAFGQPAPPPQDTNFLEAGFHMGIDTVGQSLRNANLQLRSEPPNPQGNVGPWQNSTIQPDLMRVPLEIGCGPQ